MADWNWDRFNDDEDDGENNDGGDRVSYQSFYYHILFTMAYVKFMTPRDLMTTPQQIAMHIIDYRQQFLAGDTVTVDATV